ncbi:Tn3 family transposase [Caballeronia sp. LjRoot34]
MLDGLLYHEFELGIAEHYTDTHGFTDHIFALCHALGFRFAPRIHDLREKRLHVPDDAKHYLALKLLLAAKQACQEGRIPPATLLPSNSLLYYGRPVRQTPPSRAPFGILDSKSGCHRHTFYGSLP